MSNIFDKIKKYWGAFLIGCVFFIVGISTITGIAVWAPHTKHTAFATILVVLGTVLGVLEIIEGIRLLRIPFKNK